MVANLNRDAGYTNATAFFSSKLIVDNKGGPYTYERSEIRENNDVIYCPRISLRFIRAT